MEGVATSDNRRHSTREAHRASEVRAPGARAPRNRIMVRTLATKECRANAGVPQRIHRQSHDQPDSAISVWRNGMPRGAPRIRTWRAVSGCSVVLMAVAATLA